MKSTMVKLIAQNKKISAENDSLKNALNSTMKVFRSVNNDMNNMLSIIGDNNKTLSKKAKRVSQYFSSVAFVIDLKNAVFERERRNYEIECKKRLVEVNQVLKFHIDEKVFLRKETKALLDLLEKKQKESKRYKVKAGVYKDKLNEKKLRMKEELSGLEVIINRILTPLEEE